MFRVRGSTLQIRKGNRTVTLSRARLDRAGYAPSVDGAVLFSWMPVPELSGEAPAIPRAILAALAPIRVDVWRPNRKRRPGRSRGAAKCCGRTNKTTLTLPKRALGGMSGGRVLLPSVPVRSKQTGRRRFGSAALTFHTMSRSTGKHHQQNTINIGRHKRRVNTSHSFIRNSVSRSADKHEH